jgi:hypothetical protein
MYEKWYGQPYTPKTLVEVKVCKKCGRKLKNSQAHNHCPYCGGPQLGREEFLFFAKHYNIRLSKRFEEKEYAFRPSLSTLAHFMSPSRILSYLVPLSLTVLNLGKF